MRKIKKPSPVPLYGTALIWLVYCLIFPLYRLSDFFILAAVGCFSFVVLKKFFPGTVEEIEEPITTGNEEADRLLREGEAALSEMKRLKASIKNPSVTSRIEELIDVTDKIFKDIIEDPSDIPQIRRFANYYLPTTLKLLNAYDRMGSSAVSGTNISGTMEKIENILDTTLQAYRKQYDALFANQALDIETDITVLETMLKREGLTGSDF